jgi:hypothetical protein
MKKSAITFFLAVLVILSFVGDRSRGQAKSDADKLPDGNWTFSVNPYMGPGYASRPVVVTGTVSDLSGTATSVMLMNNSSKTVSAVKVEWYFTTEQDRATVLQQGQTPLIAPSGSLPPDKYRQIYFPIANFYKLSRPLVKKNTLEGDFRLDITVAEVQYADGTTWTAAKEKPQSLLTNASHAK